MSWEEFKKPVNYISLIIGVVGLFTGFYFWYDSRQVREVSYRNNETASKIFDIDNSSSVIKLLEHDSVIINQNVYLFTGEIWNNGNLPINKEDIRKPLLIEMENVDRIVDFKITKQKDADVANFVLTKTNDHQLKVDWAYFDPGYGFQYQILVVGKDAPKFKLAGNVLGIKHFSTISINRNQTSPKWVSLIMGFFGLMFSFMVSRTDVESKTGRVIKKIIIGVLIFLVIWFCYWQLTQPISPF